MILTEDEKILLIRKQFNEKRNMEPFKNTNYYITSDDELIILDLHLGVFDEHVLCSKVSIAEELYCKYNKRVNILVLSDGNVRVSEHSICSFADFSIKLSVIDKNFCENLLDQVHDKINNLDITDLKFIGLLSLLID